MKKKADVYLFGQRLGTHSFLLKDAERVRFASATSAVSISRFPLSLNPPKQEEIQA